MGKKKLQRRGIPPAQATSASPDEKIDNFDEILAVIGAKGRYQKLLLYGIVSPTIAIIPIIGFNALFIHGELDHWCYQEGIEEYNETMLKAWKREFLPTETGPDGNERFSQCQMYNISNDSSTIIDCPSGWSYDRSDLRSTVISDYDWVCSKNGYLTLLYTICSIGGLLGNFIFGPLADKYGRKPIYFIGFFIRIFFGFIALFVAGNYALYVSLNFISGTGVTGELLSLVLAEFTDDAFRSWARSFTSAIWVVGMCATPFIAYLAQDWFIIGLTTYVPCFLLLLYVFVLPESPRWLISVGRIEEAAIIIKQIAKINGTDSYVEDDKLNEALALLVEDFRKKSTRKEQAFSVRHGISSLCTKLNVLKITILLIIASIGKRMLYGGITLNTANLAGNQFLNFFILGLIECPSSFIAGYFLGTLGRRWTQVFAYLAAGFACFVAALAVGNEKLALVVTIAVIFTKLTITITYVGLSLQQTELYPTPLRSTGGAIVAVVSGVAALATPAMIYLGKYYAAGPYFVMVGLSFLSAIAAAFLPETLNKTLPETIEHANEFGKQDKFWRIRTKRQIRPIKYGSLRRLPHNVSS